MTTERYNNILRAGELVHLVHANTDANGNVLISHAQKVECVNLVNYFYGSKFKEAHINCCHSVFMNILFQLKVMYNQELTKELAEYLKTDPELTNLDK
jgi:hypothetical protein